MISMKTSFTKISHSSQCIQLVDEVLAETSLTVAQINKVVFVGGGTRMPKLVEMFKSKFPTTTEILNTISPEEVLSVGAAIEASLLVGRDDIKLKTPLQELQCNPKNIGIMVMDADGNESLEVLLPKHTPSPARRTRTFAGAPEQTSVELSVYESEGVSVEGAQCLAKLVMKDIPSDKIAEFTLTTETNRAGNLVVTLLEKGCGKTEHVTISMDGGS